PLGVVALDARASGRPVVATRTGGAAEVVPPGGPGRVVDPRDPGAIAAALDELVSDPPDPDVCRRYAVPHGVDRQAERVLAVLTAVAREAPGR
ncbi:MAG: glycosyltransferase, partial [Miltoncostaeaceae bacterium]